MQLMKIENALFCCRLQHLSALNQNYAGLKFTRLLFYAKKEKQGTLKETVSIYVVELSLAYLSSSLITMHTISI